MKKTKVQPPTRARRDSGESSSQAAGATIRWTMLMPNLPGKATTKRVRVWRRLQSVGAIAVRPSVWVLPARDECVETFQWIAREIVAMGGQASLCEGHFVDGITDEEIERRFVEARNADYAKLSEEARDVAKALKGKRVSVQKLALLEARLARAMKRLAEIAAIDFAGASERGAVEGVLMGLERALAARRAPPDAGALTPTARPRGATWVTRTGVHVDRLACVWLIRHFIDHDATFKFVPPKGYVPEAGDLRFDMYDAEFTHVGERCSFEVLLERMEVDEPGLREIGEIIHDIDVRDDRFGRPETAGVRSQITGICATHRDDAARIAAAEPVFEALRAFFAMRPSQTGLNPSPHRR
jgi:hypothetical protein